jgi:sugar/nucleoside kinase (ribokinase family)
VTGFALQADPVAGFTQVVGVGGIGTGTIFALEENHTLGRNESRMGQLLEGRDYCKLHIVEHYIAVLLDSKHSPETFRVFAVSNVGSDAAGGTLLGEMAEAGIDTRYVKIDRKCGTLFSVSFLYPDKSGGNITASNSAACGLSSSQLQECRTELASAAGHGIALCLPEVPIAARHEFLRLAAECGSYRVASFPSAEMETVNSLNLLSQVDLLALNREETAAVAGGSLAAACGERILDTCSAVATAANPNIRILSSAGPDGAYVFERGAWSHFPAVPAKVVSTAGAGDALLAGVLAGLAAGLPLTGHSNARDSQLLAGFEIDSAIRLGLLLAGFSTTSPHTIHPAANLESLLVFSREKKIELSNKAS